MFGGVGFLILGNMACGVNGEDLIVRVGADGYEDELGQPHTRPFDMTGRPMSGWVMVSAEGCEKDAVMQLLAFSNWVRRGVEFARSLPAK